MFAFGGIGPGEIVLIVVALLLLFGGRKIPELARGLGQGIREFQMGMRGKSDKKPEAGDKNGGDDSDASRGA